MENTETQTEKKEPVKIQIIKINSKQKKFLKGLGHHLKPTLYIGKEGLSTNVYNAAEAELTSHELVKVKIGKNSDADKKVVAAQLSETTGAAVVQIIGKTIILFRPNKKLPVDKRISLPR